MFATFGWPRQTIPPVESILENLMGQLMAFWNNFLCSRKEEEEPPLVADLWHGDTYNQLTTPPRGKNFLETPPRGPWCSSGLEHVLQGAALFCVVRQKVRICPCFDRCCYFVGRNMATIVIGRSPRLLLLCQLQVQVPPVGLWLFDSIRSV